MNLQSERPQEKRLSQFGLRIITSFWDEHAVRRRASDGSLRDDVVSGVIMDKKYERGGRLLRTETYFNPLMRYSFVINEKLRKSVQCPNCGWQGQTAEFVNGCPYCGAVYQVTYDSRQSAAQRSAEKKAKQLGEHLRALAVSLAVCIGVALLWVLATGRTFGLFDVLKGLAFGAAFGLAVFYGLYQASARRISQKAEEAYQRQTAMLQQLERGLAELNLTLDGFFTCLNTEMAAGVFAGGAPENSDIVDFDILEYNGLRLDREGGAASVRAEMTVRVLRMRNNRLCSARTTAHAVLKANRVQQDPLHPEKPVVHCHACGSSIDRTKAACDYCGAPIRYMQPLYLTQLRL